MLVFSWQVYNDLKTMTRCNQRYFGDWASYNGKGDVGYYLGTKFVHKLSENYSLEELINMKIERVYQEFIFYAQ